jgi:hypothetical protein
MAEKMISVRQLINKLSDNGVPIDILRGNRNIMEVSKATKRKPAYIKLAVNDEVAERFLCNPMKAFAMLFILPMKETMDFLDGYATED